MNSPVFLVRRSLPAGLRTFWLLLALAAAIATPLLAAAPAWHLQVVTDREDALYETGEVAKFLVTVTSDGRPVSDGQVTYTVDDFITEFPPANELPKGELALTGRPVPVSVTSQRPGFLRCQVSFTPPGGKRLQATAGAGFSPLQ
ncbi:MAG: hypothetical protein ACYC6Y_05870, partial [Thermoguttaceae bacterium]